MIGDKYLVIIKKRKKVIVRLEGKIIFNNLKTNASFRKWKKEFKKKHKGVKRKRLKSAKIKEIESVYIDRKQNVRVKTIRDALIENMNY